MVVGEIIRNRTEWRRENVRRLVEASMGLAMLYTRMCGDVIDAKRRGDPLDKLPSVPPDRHAAVTRFFLTPGSEELREKATALMEAHRQLRASFDSAQEWAAAWSAYDASIREFEAAVRAVIRRGRV